MAQVPATSYESTSLGDVAEFTIPFPFLSRAEVFVTVDGAAAPFTWINDGLIQLSTIPELGATVRRYRSTEAFVPLHQFSQGVPFLPRYVDRDFKQNLYAVQESVNDTANTAALALATAEESLVLVQDAFNMLGERTQYIVLGPYAAGLEFQTTSQVFSYLGEFYAPSAGVSLPYTTTGVGAAEIATFRSVGDAVLRGDLDSSASDKGAAIVTRATRHFFSVADLVGVAGRYNGDTANLLSFWLTEYNNGGALLASGVGIGGSVISWHATMPKSSHDGGMIISPTVPAPAAVANLQSYFDGVGETDGAGMGCWVRNAADGVVYVSYYGAVPGGTVDMTPAFNAATRGYKQYGVDPMVDPIDNDTEIKRVIGVPSSGFAYRIEGTVYVRKGQHLRGQGDGPSRIFIPVVASAVPTFKLAYGLIGGIGGVEIVDNGGLPPSISNLCTEGGHTLGGAVVEATGVAGVSMYKMFITAAPLGFKGSGGDLVLNSCTFDDCTRPCEITGSRNTISDCHFFHPLVNGVLVGTGSYDWLIRDCTFAFCEQQDILIQGGVNTVRGLSIVDCNFIENGQYATKNTHIGLNMAGAEVLVADCNFSNSKSWGIADLGTGNENFVTVRDCHFTGRKSNAAYIQSSTTRGIRVGSGFWTISGCDFHSMYDTPIHVFSNQINDRIVVKDNTWVANIYTGPLVSVTGLVGTARLVLEGNVGDGVMPLIAAGNFTGVRLNNNTRWLGAPVTAGGRIAYTIPTFASFAGTLKVIANPLPGGSTLYRKAALFAVSRGTDSISAAVRDYVEFTSLHNPAVGTAGALSVQFDINALGGGANITPTAVGRNVVVSVPDTYANFEVEVA